MSALRLVLVEDFVPDADLVLSVLARAGYQVDASVVGSEARLHEALVTPPDLVISDYSLAALDGLRVLEIVLATGLDTPFILVSGTVSEELAVEAMQRGAVDYVSKDRIGRLGSAVARALELREARRESRRAQAVIRDSEARLRAILDNEPECVKLVAADGTIVDINRAGLRMLEAESVEEVRNRGLAGFVQPSHQARFAECFSRVLGGEACTFEFQIEGLRGTPRWMETHAAPLRLPHESRAHFLAVTRDVSAQKLAEERLLRLTRMHAVLGAINSIIVRARHRGELLRDACLVATLQGQFAATWIGFLDRDRRRLLPAAQASDDLPHSKGAFPPEDGLDLAVGGAPFIERAIRGGVLVVASEDELGRSGMTGLASAVALPLLRDGEVTGMMALYSTARGFFDDQEMRLLGNLAGDVSFALAHLEMRERSEYLAVHDPLTGLPNRTLLLDRVEQALRAAGPHGEPVAVAFLSIERFRHINESIGRQSGDELLRRVAERLRGVARLGDTVARAGGSRFALLLDGISTPAAAASLVAERVLAAFERPVMACGQEFRIALKAGIALGAAPRSDAEGLCSNAESALRSLHGGARYTFYAPEMNARMAASLALERRLRLALERDQLRLHYQPIVAAASGALRGLEALLRWQDPQRGLVPPAEFIPLMEETGLIVEAGRWVLRQAMRDAHAWRSQGLAVPPIAINVSASQLRQPGLVDEIRECLDSFAAPGPVLTIEITESVLMQDMAGAIATLERLRTLGVTAAVDDFGTGYSSLAYVARLPVAAIKIDRSFIGKLGSDAASLSIVTSVIALGRALRLRVVGEGVETPQQRRMLAELGCEELQGYGLGRPACAKSIAALLARRGSD